MPWLRPAVRPSLARLGRALALAAVAACGGSPSASSSASPAASTPGATLVSAPQLTDLDLGGKESAAECAAGAIPDSPTEYGVCVLDAARQRAGSRASVKVVAASDPAAAGVVVDSAPESYAITQQAGTTLVVGRDAVGAMYGALDVAERLDSSGAAALPLAAPVKASPTLSFRGANLFLVLPQAGETAWWFRDESFWTEYLDMMARARLNFLDLHGMYDADNTRFPNALLYFATSASYPGTGAPAAERATNLTMLNRVIAMATARGIQVGLMSYLADLSLLGDGVVAPSDASVSVSTYIREAAFDLATRAPGLTALGFRIGETNRPPSWYEKTFVAGVTAAHAKAVPYTRTWLTAKADLLSLVAATGPDTIVEAKYNGEHLGLPYVVSGGMMSKWGSYSFQDYLEPPTPYRFVFQIRAGGTHRMFRYASYERTRRTVLAARVSPRVAGFTFEAAHAYLPQRDFYHRVPADSFSRWTFRRDELSYLLFGRLGYDPTTPESVFRGVLARRVGTDGLWAAVQAASDITPWIQTAFTCGPDQRDYAPELEMGGPVGFWASPGSTIAVDKGCIRMAHETFDEFAVALPYEAAQDLLQGQGTSRLSPVDVARTVLADADAARTATGVSIDPSNAEARDVVRECVALSDLGGWFGHKLLAATALAVYQGSAAPAWLDAARSETVVADAAYTTLAADTAYIATFSEQMRMARLRLPDFHWSEQLPRLGADMESIDLIATEVTATPSTRLASAALPDPAKWLATGRERGPGLVALDVAPQDPTAPLWTVAITLASSPPPGAAVRLLYRPFRSDGADWAAVDATGSGASWSATVPGTGAGGMFAVEVVGGPGTGWRYPDMTVETPYRAVAP